MEVSSTDAYAVNANQGFIITDGFGRRYFLKAEFAGALQYDCFHE
jgi:hypothetical protein